MTLHKGTGKQHGGGNQGKSQVPSYSTVPQPARLMCPIHSHLECQRSKSHPPSRSTLTRPGATCTTGGARGTDTSFLLGCFQKTDVKNYSQQQHSKFKHVCFQSSSEKWRIYNG